MQNVTYMLIGSSGAGNVTTIPERASNGAGDSAGHTSSLDTRSMFCYHLANFRSNVMCAWLTLHASSLAQHRSSNPKV